jgi:tRNA A37 threonylcarbamoyladenosine synthetase subunit TsaC/SUA5/YrdC
MRGNEQGSVLKKEFARSHPTPEEIRDRLQKEVELVIDSGVVAYEPTTIIDLTGANPEITRQGRGIAENLR